MKDRAIISLIPALAILFLSAGCAEIVQIGTAVGRGTGYISETEKESIDRAAIQTAKAVRPITNREEYYVGRSVAATILSQYRLYNNKPLTTYINQLGTTLALASNRPFTYGGYHFAILDSNEVNALACPGGTIFITRGMLKKAANEEELAAILAHEITHVNNKDGLAAIKRSRWVEVVATVGAETTRQLSGGDLDKVASLFEGSVNDVVKTLIVNGYGREQELAADKGAMIYMHRLGYDPRGLIDYLAKLANEQRTGADRGFFATHPDMAQRLFIARSFLGEKNWSLVNHHVRDRRFSHYRKML